MTPSRLFERIEAKRDALVATTADLVRFATVNPPGADYEPCARYIGERMAGLGFAVDYIRAKGAPGDGDRHPRINVVARRAGAAPGPTVHINGHIDVVAAGEGWTVPPFAGLVRDGRVWGRGTADMKGGIAAAMIALEALIEVGGPLPGTLELSGTADEESGGFGGVGHLARLGLFDPGRVDHVLIPEPLGVDRVCLGHRGVWWAEVEITGRIGHGSMPFLGVSAIRGMGDFLALLETELLPRLAERTTRMPCVPEGARAATLNLNSLHGGLAETDDAGLPAPLVADRCRLVLDRRWLVEESPDSVRAEVVELLERVKAKRAGLDWRMRDLMSFPPTMTDPEAPVVAALDHWIHRVLGRPSRHVASPGTYDQKHLARFGGALACVAYGPGDLEQAHQPDEHVEIDDLVASAKVLAATVATLIGVDWTADAETREGTS
ncbi:acetylornithine deacetylase/succinyl-diaminopimelate desuccinylase family protein [Siculibacillus lacustris]|uniref:Acetylornithine deacetylase/succinyl-diaminopimelate desuccinylase family protein n=1 Tax=Siculibacillus lacustris TaxID=1549641 RepID=A0A4Q9VNB8_9HYPH|nr:acetylornithine deacetylase/succinyl-diaminopimelate desuccinylase family protein [Siculibacillus lacustris]TBW36279.1 acetylornithine deacetylase/succinyl-diaminopimelate desuccinylase family protein [Siculibacillus lacustris]